MELSVSKLTVCLWLSVGVQMWGGSQQAFQVQTDCALDKGVI